MNRYIYQIYSKGQMQGTFDLITNANKATAEKAALRHALTLYPAATVKSIRAA